MSKFTYKLVCESGEKSFKTRKAAYLYLWELGTPSKGYLLNLITKEKTALPNFVWRQ